MSYYLHSFNEGNNTAELLNSIIKKYGYSIMEFGHSRGHIDSVFKLSLDGGGYYICIHEFPGNCSMFIVDHVEAIMVIHKSSSDTILNMCNEIMEKFRYGGYIITGTTPSVNSYLQEHGFDILFSDLYNPHSDMHNYMAIKRNGE